MSCRDVFTSNWSVVCLSHFLQATFTSKWWSWTEGMMQSYGSIAAVPVSATGSKSKLAGKFGVFQGFWVEFVGLATLFEDEDH